MYKEIFICIKTYKPLYYMAHKVFRLGLESILFNF